MRRSFRNALQTPEPLIRIMISPLSSFGVELCSAKSAVFVSVIHRSRWKRTAEGATATVNRKGTQGWCAGAAAKAS